jgi:hypothetical protein
MKKMLLVLYKNNYKKPADLNFKRKSSKHKNKSKKRKTLNFNNVFIKSNMKERTLKAMDML